MRRRTIYWLLPVVLFAQLEGIPSLAQVSNKPGTVTQVPGPIGTVASAPAGYITNGQSPVINFVRERDAIGRISDTIVYANAGYVDVRQTTHFVDGLGRPIQTIVQQATPGTSPADMVTPVIYDAFSRVSYNYLPYVASSGNTTDGNFKQDPFTDQQNFYQNIYPGQQPAYTGERVYYGQTIYEPSPLNRVLQTLPPGNSWAGSGVGTSQQYLVNTTGDSVVMWDITNDTLTYLDNDLSTNIPADSGYYPAAELYKNITIDEQGHATVEYKDLNGLLILKKVQIGTVLADFSGYSGWLATYYVYDDLNLLRFVLPPKAVTVAYHNGWNLSTDTTTLNELCFRYEYDYRNRSVAKKVPGAGWTYMVYDLRDRSVFAQDANTRAQNQWLTTIYDGLNRSTTTGMIVYSGTPNQLQQSVTSSTSSSSTGTVTVSGTNPSSIPATLDLTSVENGDEQATNIIIFDNGFRTPDTVNFTAEIVAGGSGGGAGSPFSNTLTVVDNPIPSGVSLIPLTMTFYDDYSNTPDKQYNTSYTSLLDDGSNQHIETIPTATMQQAVQTIGQVTGTKIHVIENPNDLTQGNWLETATYYDDRLRITQTQSDNYNGGHDTVVNLYNFTGKVLTSYAAHSNPHAGFNFNTRVKTNMNLDAENRILQTYTTVNDTAKRLVSQEIYDQVGQLMQKQIGQLPDSSFLETQGFTYNIRGWLKGINSDYADNVNNNGDDNRWFGEDLSYDWGFGTDYFNGNVSGSKWRSKGDGRQRAYGFGYDDANRFLYADFNQYNGSGWDKSAGVDFSVVMGNGTNTATAYDANGNILAMQQTAWQLGGSHLIDSLNYSYYNNSNKLQNVIDGDNNPSTTLGDFRTSSLSPYASGKTSAAVDYTYDENGNLLKDLNKDIGSQTANGIIYNYLNLPWQVSFRSATGTKGTITYIYDAEGAKLKKTTIDSSGNLETITTYIGPFQYQLTASLTSGNIPVDTLKYFAHEEGRIRLESDTIGGEALNSFKFDYFLKDHLGNTRMVLTDEQQTDMYPAATLEVGDSATENLYYMNLDSTRTALPPGYPTDTTTNPNNYVAEVGGSTSDPVIGPGIILKVMAGDQFSVRVSSWYQLNGTTPGTPVNPLTDLLAHLISGVAALPTPENPGLATLQSNSPVLSSNVLNFLQDTGSNINSSRPHAFLNWILLDNQFNYVAASSGFSQVGNNGQLNVITLTNLPIASSGYLYIYTSNETPNVNVFFDNLQVTHVRGPLLEEDHYYPFGLTMAGISDKAVKTSYPENKYRFVKMELQSKEFADGSGLDLYEFRYRFQDPQIGKFLQIDPLADKYAYNSTYAYAENRPINGIDLEGLEWWSPFLFLAENNSVIPRGPAIETLTKTGSDIAGKVADATSEAAKKPGDPVMEKHHIIPDALKDDPTVEAARDGGFKFEGKENKIPLEKFSKETGEGQHGNHPEYTKELQKQLAEFRKDNPNATPEEAVKFVRNLVQETRETLTNNPGTKVNDLFKNFLIPAPVPDATSTKRVDRTLKERHLTNAQMFNHNGML